MKQITYKKMQLTKTEPKRYKKLKRLICIGEIEKVVNDVLPSPSFLRLPFTRKFYKPFKSK